MKKTQVITLTFCALLALGVSKSHAGRPFTTEDAGVAGDKNLQTELSVDYAANDGDKNYTFLFVPVYGTGERFEVSAEFPYSFVKPEGGGTVKGSADINLAFKTLLLPEKDSTPAILFKTVLKLSNGDENNGLGSGDTDIGFTGVLSKNLSPFVFHANLGYTLTGKEKDATLKNYMLYGIALEYALNEKTKFVSEVYGESDSHFDIGAFKHHSINPLIGLTYQISKNAALDVSSKIGLTDWKKEEFGLSLGLSLSY